MLQVDRDKAAVPNSLQYANKEFITLPHCKGPYLNHTFLLKYKCNY